MRTASVFFLIGFLLFAFTLHYPWLALFLYTNLLLVCSQTSKKILLIIILLTSFVWLNMNIHWHQQTFLPEHYNQTKALLTGIIKGLPEQTQFGPRFLFAVNKIQQNHQNYAYNGQLLLLWPKQNMINLAPRQSWVLTANLKNLHINTNPYTSDIGAWYWSQHIDGFGEIISGHLLNKKLIWRPSHIINLIRNSIKNYLIKNFQANEFLGIIIALVIGDESQINYTQWQIFSATGTNHLVVIAGIHIALCTYFVFRIFNFIWRLMPKLCLLIPAQDLAKYASLLAGFIYSALAGFSVPTIRAFSMILLFILFQVRRRTYQAYYHYCLILWLILLFNPFAFLTASFWLSFISIAFILFLFVPNQANNKIHNFFRLQKYFIIGLAAWTLLFFQTVSIVSLCANLIAVPWFGFLLEPLSLCATLALTINQRLAFALFRLALFGTKIIWLILSKLASLQWASWHYVFISPYLFISFLCASLLLLMPRGSSHKILCLILLVPVKLITISKPALGSLQILFFEVGQGLSVLVRTNQHLLIYDTGPKYNEGQDAATRYINPYLWALQIKQIDKLIISHADEDHSGGANSIITNFKIGELLTSNLTKPVYQMKASLCLAGQTWQWDNIKFQFLYPTKQDLGLDNDSSCVLEIIVGKNKILLPGDIEKVTEQKLLARKLLQPVTILLAPHHGSNSSSSVSFIKSLKPSDVIFATGYDNRFQFPAHKVVLRYQAIHAKLFDTKDTGAISFIITPINIAPRLQRESNNYFWDDLMPHK